MEELFNEENAPLKITNESVKRSQEGKKAIKEIAEISYYHYLDIGFIRLF